MSALQRLAHGHFEVRRLLHLNEQQAQQVEDIVAAYRDLEPDVRLVRLAVDGFLPDTDLQPGQHTVQAMYRELGKPGLCLEVYLLAASGDVVSSQDYG